MRVCVTRNVHYVVKEEPRLKHTKKGHTICGKELTKAFLSHSSGDPNTPYAANKVDDEGARMLAEALKANPTVAKIALNGAVMCKSSHVQGEFFSTCLADVILSLHLSS